MISNPLVSVIVPIYKVEPFLRECVNSVIAQTYTNLEIILVDDGSPDLCPDICDEYAKQDSRIKVIHKSNGGLSDARNAGIEFAKGEYLSFVDSDDVIHYQMIEVLMKPILADKGLKMSACQFLEFDDGKEFNQNQELKPLEIIDFKEYFTKKIWTIACAKVYEKSIFRNIKYPVGRLHEDEFTTYKICYGVKKIAYTESTLYFYRQREGSIMTEMSLKRIVDTFDAMKEQTCFFYENNETFFYSKSLLNFVIIYCVYKKKKNYVNGSDRILTQWKTDILNFPKSKVPFTSRLHIYYMVHFTKIRNFLNDILLCFMNKNK